MNEYGSELVGRPEVPVARKGGTSTSTVPLILPADSKKGTYTVLTSVEMANSKDSGETTFTSGSLSAIICDISDKSVLPR
jgi:hypothetical protein